MPTEQSPRERALAKMRQREGKCACVGGCKCERWEPAGWADGFPICVCTHTQWAHEEGTIDA